MLLLFYMVAGSQWCPSLRAGGLVDSRVLGPTVVAMTDKQPVANAASTSLPLFPGERPSVETVLEWLKAATPLLSTEQTALLNGYEPLALLAYTAESQPPQLVAAAGGVTETAVETREALRLAISDRNALKQRQYQNHRAAMLNTWFKSLDAAFRPKAPLLFDKMERECKQAAPFNTYYDGKAAWDIVVNMSVVGAMIPGESATHDAALVALQLKPLPAGATTDEYAKRVVGALTDHIPYLERPFPNREAMSLWVVQQAPDDVATEARLMFEGLTAAQKADPHAVAAAVVDVMAKAKKPLDLLKESALGEFIGTVDDGGGGGRRPAGLRDATQRGGGRGRGRDSDGGRGGRSGGGRGRGVGGGGSDSERPKGCSTPPPRGPTCTHAHLPPCFRDPAWAGPLPSRFAENAEVLQSIKNDRAKNAARLGETVVELTMQKSETVGVLLDEVARAGDDQWPADVCPDCGDDVPPATPAPAPAGVSPAELTAMLLAERVRVEQESDARSREESSRTQAELEKLRLELELSKAQAQRAEAALLAIADAPSAPVTPVPLGVRQPTEMRADFRVNLIVDAADYEACAAAGAILDEANGVLFVPPRRSLRPLVKWLPFDIDTVGCSDDGIISPRPGIPRAAGPVKTDGSPNMSYRENIRTASMLRSSPAVAERLRASTPSSSSKRPLSSLASPVAEVDVPREETGDGGGARVMEQHRPGTADLVAQRILAISVIIAPFAVLLFALLLVITFYGGIEAGTTGALAILGHAVLGLTGGHGGVSDHNASLMQLASTPPSVIVGLLEQNSMSYAVVSLLITALAYHHPFFLRVGGRFVRILVDMVNRQTAAAILALFIWLCVTLTTALPSTEERLVQQNLLSEIADRVTGPTQWANVNLKYAHAVSEVLFNVSRVDFVCPEELVAILGSHASDAVVWDTGARRHVVRSRARLLPGTIRQCDFTIRGINSGGKQPECMGDAVEYFPLCGGDVIKLTLKGAVLMPEAPHDIVGAGLLEPECDWRGNVSSGGVVYLENHRFLLMPKCAPGRTRHSHDRSAVSVMVADSTPHCMVRSHDGRMVDVSLQPVVPPDHWSKSIIASQLQTLSLDQAVQALAGMKADLHYTLAHGPDDDHEVGASSYFSRGPYYQQYIEELRAKVPPGPKPSHSLSPSKLLYWFSGDNTSETGMRSCWEAVNGGPCLYRDVKLCPTHSILSNEVYEADLHAIRQGTVTRGVFAIPCNTFSLALFRPHPRLRPVRTAKYLGETDGTMMPGHTAVERAKVKVSNILVLRTCTAVRELDKRGGLFVIENPVWRGDETGPWKRFFSSKFSNHGSLWQMQCIVALARDTGAMILHIPLCWFVHEAVDHCSVEQKYITLMYSLALEPAPM